jgi:OmpA-OmpF porin, OOP family
MASLIQLVQETLTPEIVGKIGGLVGEAPATTESALGRAAPAVLAGVLHNSSTPGGAERMRSLVTDGGWGSDLLDTLGTRLGGGGTSSLLASGAQLISGVFGSKADSITDLIASGAGMSRGSASTILAVATPIVMSVLGKQMVSRGLSASGLATMLAGERTSLLGALPAGVSGLLGLKDVFLAGSHAEAPTTREPIAREPIPRQPTLRVNEPDVRPSGIGNWWPALLAGLAAVAFLIFLVNRGQQPQLASTRTADAPSAAPRQLASITLPDGAKVSVGEGGPVHQLSTFLANPSATDLPKRFVFDDLHFESGSARLTSEGQRTATALLAVLKAYPSVNVVLEGHTDATGDATANKALALQRAEAVKQMLVKGGVAADRIEAQGYGQERPVADNTNDAGRALNRRLELVVTKR